MEYDRLTTEATLLASQLAQALADQDDTSRQAESYRLDVVRLELDNSLVVAQLRDLGRQVRTLMRSIAATEFPGIEARSTKDAAEFDEEEEQIKRRAQVSQDTDSVVSAHLVTFKDINELQVQNQKLLRITREMGAQLEKGEQVAIERRRGAENAAVVEAHQLILRLKDEVESQRAKTEAFVRERDMFRRMLAQRGTGGEGAGAMVGRISDGMDDAPQMLADVQANFDAYRAEIAVDTQRLRDDLTAAQRDSNAASTELAKTRAQTEFISGSFFVSFLRNLPLTFATCRAIPTAQRKLRTASGRDCSDVETDAPAPANDGEAGHFIPQGVYYHSDAAAMTDDVMGADDGGAPRIAKSQRATPTRKHQFPNGAASLEERRDALDRGERSAQPRTRKPRRSHEESPNDAERTRAIWNGVEEEIGRTGRPIGESGCRVEGATE